MQQASTPRPHREREQRQVLSAGEGSIIVSRRCEVEEVLRDPGTYSSAAMPRLGTGYFLAPLELDPPAHAAWRAALDPLFAPNQVGDLTRKITLLAQSLIDSFVDEPEIDFAARFSVPFPAQVLMTLLGLPLEDLAWFLDLKDGVTRPNRALGKPLDDDEVLDYRSAMRGAAHDYFSAALDERERERTDDVLSALLDIEIDGQRVTRDVLLDVCLGLLVEGIDPMSAALDCTFVCLAEHPEFRDDVMANHRQALEELLRWESPVTFVERTATRDTVLGGCPVRGGQRIRAMLGAANIDSEESPDADVLRWNRKVNPHLTFGTGTHRCLGSHLARLELSIALREWHARIPRYSVRRSSDLVFTPRVRTVDRFPIRLGR